MSITFKVDVGGVQQLLNEIKARGVRPGAVLSTFRGPARADQMDHGREARGPSGPWQPRATAPASKKKRAKMRRRRLLGRLSSAVNTSVRGGKLVVESQIKWAGVHQRGGTAGRGARIPAREFLWWSEDVLDFFAKQIADYLVGEGR